MNNRSQKREDKMNKSQKLIKLFEGFSSDSEDWYDELADLAQTEGVPQELVNWANAQHNPTESELAKLKTLLQKQDLPIIEKILKFIENMEQGTYEKEFKKMFGDTSQVSELFSFLKQAILYYE